MDGDPASARRLARLASDPSAQVRLAVATWEWGAYYGDSKFKGAKLDISKWKRPSPETIPSHAKAAGLYMIYIA